MRLIGDPASESSLGPIYLYLEIGFEYKRFCVSIVAGEGCDGDT